MSTLPLTFNKELIAGNVKNTMKEVGASRGQDSYMVDPRKIKFIEGFNARTDRPEYTAHIDNLAQSIIANGFYQEKAIAGFVAVEDGVQVIYATEGHSRVKASIVAMERGSPLEAIPMIVKPRGTTMEDLNVALITSNDGLPLTPYEVGVVCKRLKDAGWETKKIAQRISRTAAYVDDLLGLVAAPKVIREMVSSGQVSATLANKEIREHGAKAVVRLQEGLKSAQAAGKTKVTGKHVGVKPGAAKLATLRLNGVIAAKHKVGEKTITITLPEGLEVELFKGDTVKIVVTQGDDL